MNSGEESIAALAAPLERLSGARNAIIRGWSFTYRTGISVNLLVFDVDGTLTATNEVDTRCFARAFLETFGIALNTSWHIYPHRTDSGIICHSFSQHFRRAPTAGRARFIPRAFSDLAGKRMAR